MPDANGDIAGLMNDDGEILAVGSLTSNAEKAAGVPSASSSLDAHFAALGEGTPAGDTPPVPPAAPVPPTPAPNPTPAAPATPPANPLPNDPAPAPAPAAPPSDDIEGVTVPPNVRGATAEAFAKVKAAAKIRVDALGAEIAQLKADLESARAAGAKPLTAELERELAELRAFRERTAIAGDPVFESRFGKPVADIDSEIFSAIGAAATAAGADGAALEVEARKLGVNGIDWETLYKSNPSLRLKIERKLMRRDELLEARKSAEDKARTNTDEWVRERAGHVAEADKQRFVSAATELDGLFQTTEGLAPAAPPAGAAKEVLDGHRAYTERLNAQKAQIRAMVASGDPRSIAELGAAAALTVRWQSEALGARPALASAQERIAAAEAKVTAAEKRAVDAEAKLAAIQKATRIGGNFPRTGERATGAPTQANPKQSAESAMDSHFKAQGIPTSG